MPIDYTLLDNPLTEVPGDARAIPQNVRSANDEVIYSRMTSRGSTATRAEVFGVLEEYKLAIEELLAEGYRINTDLVNVGVSIRGVFDSLGDVFDPDRHTIAVNVTAGTRLKRVTQRIRLSKVPASPVHPILHSFEDAKSGSGSALTPGGSAIMQGTHLKIRDDVPGSGVFFIDGDGVETPSPRLLANRASEIICEIPALDAGEYRLELRTGYSEDGPLRTGQFSGPLTVAG